MKGQGACWHFNHNVRGDAADTRLVDVLRLPGLFLGVAAILLTAGIGRRLSRDPWTPVVAAATLACIPTFVFDTTSVNNDNLAMVLAALATWLAIVLVADPDLNDRKAMLLSAGLGAVVAALAQSKLTTVCLIPAILVAVWLAADNRRVRASLLGIFIGTSVAVAGWWLIRNVRLYGDPFALTATRRYNSQVGLPAETSGIDPLRQIFIEVPKIVWRGFWYSWYEHQWSFWAFVPLWGLSLLGLLGLRRGGGRIAVRRDREALVVLGLFAVGGLASVWLIGVQDRVAQGRLAMIGMPAFAGLIALGFERARLARITRFALPLISLTFCLVALVADVLLVRS